MIIFNKTKLFIFLINTQSPFKFYLDVNILNYYNYVFIHTLEHLYVYARQFISLHLTIYLPDVYCAYYMYMIFKIQFNVTQYTI